MCILLYFFIAVFVYALFTKYLMKEQYEGFNINEPGFGHAIFIFVSLFWPVSVFIFISYKASTAVLKRIMKDKSK